jgi:hypothetical protein
MINIEAIAANLEQNTCPEHGQHPKINIVEEGLSIAACCQAFHDQTAMQLQQDIDAAMSKVMEEAMKHLR